MVRARVTVLLDNKTAKQLELDSMLQGKLKSAIIRELLRKEYKKDSKKNKLIAKFIKK